MLFRSEDGEEEDAQIEDNDTNTVKDSDDLSDEDYLIEEEVQKSTFTIDDIQDENPSDPGVNNENPVFKNAQTIDNENNDSNFEQTYGSVSDVAAGEDKLLAEENPPDIKQVKKPVY